MKPDSKQKLIIKQYELEREYANKILASEKNSIARKQLIKEAYNKVIDLIYQYNKQDSYSHFNDFTVALVKKNLPSKKGLKILDFGCGEGNLIYSLNKQGYEAYGFDVNEGGVKEAKKKLEIINKQNYVFQGDFRIITGNYDAIVMDNVIEHLVPDEVDDILNYCYKLLNKDGVFIIITPHPFSGPHDISQKFIPLGAKAQGLHLKEYKVIDLIKILKQTNFKIFYSYYMHPRILYKLKIFFKANKLAIYKSLLLEKLFSINLFNYLFKINRNFSRFLTALFFPVIVIAKK